MSDSTARRERLASPIALALLAGSFALAFALLRPEHEDLGAIDPAGRGLDAVDVAYLRARAAAGEPVDDAVDGLALGLLEAGRVAETRDLLAAFPDAPLGARTAFLLELETAAAALAAETDAAMSGTGADPTLVDALETLLGRLEHEPALGGPATLARGARLSRRLERPALTAALHARLAEADPANASAAWADCGRAAAAAGARARAVDCYRRAIDTLGAGGPDGALVDAERLADDAFDLRLALLAQLVGEEDEVARGAVAEALLARDTTDAPRLEALARGLLAAERPGEAASVYGRLAERDPERAGRWWTEAARWSEAAGRPDLAAAWIDRAARIAAPAERAALERRVEALLTAAGRELEVLERVGARIESSPGDLAALRDGIALARRAGRPERAERWNETLLERAPGDADALAAAIDLALARGDLEAARTAAERAVFRRPEEREARVRLAQVAEWSGDPVVATAQWRILAATDPDGATLRELVRLARLTRQPGVAADAARRLALLSPPGNGDVERLVELYELDGRPGDAAAAVEAILDAHGADPDALRTLARLNERHGRLRDALDAWERRAALVDAPTAAPVGADVEATLARAALHWRLDERDAAGRLAGALRGADLSGVDGRTATLLSEIAWRERDVELALAAAPALVAIDDAGRRALHGRRLVRSLAEEGRFAEAVAEADRLWKATADTAFAIEAMTLAERSGDTAVAAPYLVAGAVVPNLGADPEYWSAAAALRLREADLDAARRDYERALELDPDDPTTLSALLWLLIDAGEADALASLLDEHAERAVGEPALWSAYALGRLGLDEPEASLAWFERLSDRIGTDYSLLLGYADALEAVGRADDALRLRRHALAKLRPALDEALEEAVDGAPGGRGRAREALLREYVALASRHGGLDERWTRALLADADTTGGDDPGDAVRAVDRWREDVAIAWLLSSERHEHARLVMARAHAERAAAPAWQRLSVALAANDVEAVAAVLDSGARLSAADRLLALRAVGDERAAHALAARAMRTARDPATRDFAAGTYAELRAARPSWVEGFARRSSLGALDTDEAGVAARHTFAGTDLGLSFEAVGRSLRSGAVALDGRDELAALSLSLHRGDSRRGLRLDAGVESGEAGELVRGGLGGYLRDRLGRRELAAELQLAERPTESSELVAGAVRDRAGLYAESAFGHREYVSLLAEATELRTRGEGAFVARGATGRLELGLRGATGASEWSASVAATHARHDRADAPPADLGLSAGTDFDAVLAPRTTNLALGGSIVHAGGVRAEFPRTGGPRWFADASVDHDWPARSFGLRVHTGLGLRVIGGDELAFTLSHDTRAESATGADGTSLGVGYRFHF